MHWFLEALILFVVGRYLHSHSGPQEAISPNKTGPSNRTLDRTIHYSSVFLCYESTNVQFVSCTLVEKHFIDKHRKELIKRVTTVEPILDELLDQGVITHEEYSNIRSKPDSYAKMRELMDHRNIRESQKSKNILEKALMENNPFLMDDLK